MISGRCLNLLLIIGLFAALWGLPRGETPTTQDPCCAGTTTADPNMSPYHSPFEGMRERELSRARQSGVPVDSPETMVEFVLSNPFESRSDKRAVFHAVLLLRYYWPEEGEPAFRHLIREKSPCLTITRIAAEALVEHGDVDATRILVSMIETDPKVLCPEGWAVATRETVGLRAAGILAKARIDKGYQLTKTKLKHKRGQVRSEAAKALASFSALPTKHPPGQIVRLLESLADDPDSSVRFSAVYALTDLLPEGYAEAQRAKALRRFLKDSRELTQHAASRWLRKHGYPDH